MMSTWQYLQILGANLLRCKNFMIKKKALIMKIFFVFVIVFLFFITYLVRSGQLEYMECLSILTRLLL